VSQGRLAACVVVGLGKNLLRFQLECAHRADVRDRTVADARDTELRQASFDGTPSMTMTLTGSVTPSQIRPMSAAFANPGMKKPDAPAAA
jgi:hypothetical protein